MELLAVAGVEGPLVLVGHSYGGMVAQLTAHRHPDRVVGVVLVDSASRREMEGEWLANDVPWIDGATEVDRPVSATELAAVDDLGAIPLVVLTQGRTSGQFAVEWTRLQNELAILSTNTVHVVADTGHMIQDEAPDLVKRAVASVVQSARTGTKLPPCGQVFAAVGATCVEVGERSVRR
jgi:pimeloyl-ACP methyl ester carboxylesterase